MLPWEQKTRAHDSQGLKITVIEFRLGVKIVLEFLEVLREHGESVVLTRDDVRNPDDLCGGDRVGRVHRRAERTPPTQRSINHESSSTLG